MAVMNRVASVFGEVFAVDSGVVTRETVPDDIEKWDSLGHMKMVEALEEEFDLHFELDDMMEMVSVDQILEILATKGVSD